MSATARQTIHASAVRVGDRAILIRGPSGAGKSRLAFDLILAGRIGQIPATTLVGDDRLYLDAIGDQLLVRPPKELEGLIEIRGLGIRRCAFVAGVQVGLVMDLCAHDAERLPPPEAMRTAISGVELARIPVAANFSPLPLAIAALTTTEDCIDKSPTTDCRKEFGNHISPTIATD